MSIQFPMKRQSIPWCIAALLAASLSLAPWQTQAQSRKDSVILGMILEPTSLDPTMAPAAAIGEVVHYNILEGLTKINVDGSISPLLAEGWKMDADGKAYTFKLRKGVKFQDGTHFDSAAVKFSFDRAKDPKSTNKAKGAVFNNISHIATPDVHTVVLVLNNPDGNFLFRMGENTAVILHPDSAGSAATKPIGTGPYKLDNWAKGTAVTLSKWDGFRDASAIKLKKVTFRFINDSAAQVAALLAGDIDGMPRFQSPQSLKQFQANKRFVVEMGSTAGKGIMTINNRKKPFDDVRVRRALSHAVDKRAFIDGVFEGLAKPIGSHMAPTDAGYVELSGLYAYDPEKAKALLKEAGVQTPLNVTLTLPPPPYARKGGEILAAQLAKVGIVAKIENVEWAQWLGGTFKGNFDLTVINHVEPLDYMNYANAQYYWGYDSKAFRDLAAKHSSTTAAKERTQLFGDMQRMIAKDAVNVFLFNASNTAVYRKGLKGLWSSSPIFANDMAAASWQ
ncbi:ABC transporter substrate-binding protein [Limnohabitans sp. 2KL-17]|uniref:ABC transporter substrate-binding protein n=1 Tax=Limnohabitans sp. 2KL-17 TaxID=1100704 RepID=UPI000D3AF686|nr:ABC transporter substrate-binding protein [Limnohabitans sp. 2KL-17]PUE54954.1 ABC transporter substrate-binding protein [Limnohabitans sp. 2KL-17]